MNLRNAARAAWAAGVPSRPAVALDLLMPPVVPHVRPRPPLAGTRPYGAGSLADSEADSDG